MNKILSVIKSPRPQVVLKAAIYNFFLRKINWFDHNMHLFIDKRGIEIGGPSPTFTDRGLMPIYSISGEIDGCNFSINTTWEGVIEEGKTYKYFDDKYGFQYICEGAEVSQVPKGIYDFVLSCNNLEHIANPIKAIKNWINLLKPGGVILLVLPRKQSNFDRKRPYTTMQHLLNDYELDIGEDDLTHIHEILELHDLKLDPFPGDYTDFELRCLDNLSNRCLHHHVFSMSLLKEVCYFSKLKVVFSRSTVTDHVILAQTPF